jgi:protein gp37
MDTRYGKVKWGPGEPRNRTGKSNWNKPLKWDKEAKRARDLWAQCGAVGSPPERPRVFSLSLGDILDSEVPAAWLADALNVIYKTPNLDWLLLTKRPKLWRKRLTEAVAAMRNDADVSDDAASWTEAWLRGEAPSNVWMGVTVESQEYAWRVDELAKIPARVRFLSVEPMLGFVDIGKWAGDHNCHNCNARFWGDDLRDDHLTSVDYYDTGEDSDALEKCPRCGYESMGTDDGTIGESEGDHLEPVIHWVICGGESGREARFMHPAWAASLRDQCQAAEIPFHFKQHGAWAPICEINEMEMGIYKSNRKAPDPDHQHIFDELYGQTCKVPNGVSGIDGTLMDVTEMWSFHHDRRPMHVFKVGKKKAGRLLGGREWNEVPKTKRLPMAGER